MRLLIRCVTIAAMLHLAATTTAHAQTYAERLGWGPEDRLVIFHNDDAGMSYESNLGTIEGFERGVMNSVSTMMPCSWVPQWRDYLLEHPDIDNGLHLTLTSEWKHYRWRPVATIPAPVNACHNPSRGNSHDSETGVGRYSFTARDLPPLFSAGLSRRFGCC